MKRGRKSAEEANVIAVQFGKSGPEPLPDLNDRQREIWIDTVATEAPELFATGAMQAMLADYCRHREAAENVSSIINGFKPEWLKSAEGAKRYHGLLKMRDMETRAAAGLARGLRLTNQSRYRADSAVIANRNVARVSKPWEQ